MTLKLLFLLPVLSFVLNDALSGIADIRPVNLTKAPHWLSPRDRGVAFRGISPAHHNHAGRFHCCGSCLRFEWTYHGLIDDPPREPRHLRFVTPSETSGYIGPEGDLLKRGDLLVSSTCELALPVFHVHVTYADRLVRSHARTAALSNNSGRQDGRRLGDWIAKYRSPHA